VADFGAAYSKTMSHEGGYVDDPTDRGGETYKGIARRYNPDWVGWQRIDSYRDSPDFPQVLEEEIDLPDEVESFYKAQYWDKFLGDEIEHGAVAQELFDTAVNMGVHRAVKFLQVSLSILNRNGSLFADLVDDGVFGAKTLASLRNYQRTDSVALLLKVMNVLQGMHYIEYMRKSPEQEKFARGWFTRVSLGPE